MTRSTPGAATAAPREQRLTGIGVSPGIAIGPAYIGERGDLPVEETPLDEARIDAERARFAEAVAASLKQLRKLKARATALPGSAADEIGYLLDAHLAMLANSRLVRGVNQRIARRASMPSARSSSKSTRSASPSRRWAIPISRPASTTSGWSGRG